MKQRKKIFDYKKLKLIDDYNYTSDEEEDGKLKLDAETKRFFDEIIEREKDVDWKGFSGYFNYEPSSLVRKLLSQNTQDLKKDFGRTKKNKRLN